MEEQKRKVYFPDKGSLICPPGKSMMLTNRIRLEIELVARPGISLKTPKRRKKWTR